MIRSYKELKYYLDKDRIALKVNRNKPKFFSDEIWKYQILLRKCEYYFNIKKNILEKLIYRYYRFNFHRKEIQLGFSIPLNCFGAGLRIVHRGTIVINGNTKIGENCTIHIGVNIGSKPNMLKSPIFGDNLYIGPGAKIYGDIIIGHNVFIGANAVVNKNFEEGNCTIVGIPAVSKIKK